jgi:hypothetical protein
MEHFTVWVEILHPTYIVWAKFTGADVHNLD